LTKNVHGGQFNTRNGLQVAGSHSHLFAHPEPVEGSFYSLSLGRRGGQASNEDLFPLGYGERDRVRVRANTN